MFTDIFGNIGDAFSQIVDIRLDQEVEQVAGANESVAAQTTGLPGGGTASTGLSSTNLQLIGVAIAAASLLFTVLAKR